MYMTSGNFKEWTNNRLESLNQKLKLFFPLRVSLSNFLKNFFEFYDILQDHKNIEAVKMFFKVPNWPLLTDMRSYYDLLTLYGFLHVIKEAEKIDNYICVSKVCDNSYSIVSSVTEKVKYTVTSTTCTCPESLSMQLPCRHIFKIRTMENLSLFDNNLTAERWQKDYYEKCIPDFARTQIKKRRVTFKKYAAEKEKENFVEKTEARLSLSSRFFQANKVSKPLNVDKKKGEIKEKRGLQRIFGHLIFEKNNQQQDDVILENVKKDQKILSLKRKLIDESDCHQTQQDENSKPAEMKKKKGNKELEEKLENINIVRSEDLQMDTTETVDVFEKNCEDEKEASHENSQIELLMEKEKDDELEKEENIEDDLSNVLMQPNIMKKGRPKGKVFTAVGTKKVSVVIPRKYEFLSDIEKKVLIIKKIIKSAALKNKAINSNRFCLNDLKNFSDIFWICDEKLDIDIIKPDMETEAFDYLKNKIENTNTETLDWFCEYCKQLLANRASIQCDRCLDWLHFKCVCLKKPPPGNSQFFCHHCVYQVKIKVVKKIELR